MSLEDSKPYFASLSINSGCLLLFTCSLIEPPQCIPHRKQRSQPTKACKHISKLWLLTGSTEGTPNCFLLTLRCTNNNDHYFD